MRFWKKLGLIVITAHVIVFGLDFLFCCRWPDERKDQQYRDYQLAAEKRIRAEKKAEITGGGAPQK